MIVTSVLLVSLFVSVVSFRGLSGRHYFKYLVALNAGKVDDQLLSAKDIAKKSTIPLFKASFAALSGFMLSSRSANAGLQYLTDPTADFKEQEAKSRAFNAAQNKARQQWDGIMGRFEGTEEPEELARALRDMKTFISETNDIPAGVSKRALVKSCRAKKLVSPKSRKTKPYWTTQVEIEYQALIQEFNRKLVPVNVVSAPASFFIRLAAPTHNALRY